VRYKTLGILCFVRLGPMFAVPATIWAIFCRLLKRGLRDPLPVYERVLFHLPVFSGIRKRLLVLPLVGLGLSFVAELASSRAGK
jgi:hypothetical protein